jgi:hypothetical protein
MALSPVGPVMSTAGATDREFFSFYREYTHTGIHAATTAGLTAFGLLTFVHRAFVVLAIGIYVLPPIYLYLTRDGDAVETVGDPDSDVASEDEPVDQAEPSGSASASSVSDSSGTPTDEPAASTESVDRAKGNDPSDAAATTEAGHPNDRSQAGPTTGGGETSGSAAASEEFERSDEGSDRAPRVEAGDSTDTAAGETTDEAGTDTDGKDGIEAGIDGDGSDREAERGGVETDSSVPSRVPTDEADDRDGTGEPDPRAEEETVDEPTTLEWTEVDSPTDETLSDAVRTGSGAYAVGSGGVVLAREEEGWEPVLEHGPAAESNALVGVDATDDGEAVWFTGDSGALGRHDVVAGRHTDHSAPEGITDNWVDVAVAGPAGEERVYLVNGSGQVLAGEFDGSEVGWGEAVKPGSGSSMSAVEFAEGTGYCCDTNSGVYETTDGESFERIGIKDGGSFTAIAAAGPERLAVADADGTIQRYDGRVWTPLRAAEVALDALSTDGSDWLAAGDGGTILELVEGGWEPCETPVEANLHGVAVGEPSVAVGAEGTIVELRPAEDGD